MSPPARRYDLNQTFQLLKKIIGYQGDVRMLPIAPETLSIRWQICPAPKALGYKPLVNFEEASAARWTGIAVTQNRQGLEGLQKIRALIILPVEVRRRVHAGVCGGAVRAPALHDLNRGPGSPVTTSPEPLRPLPAPVRPAIPANRLPGVAPHNKSENIT